MSVIFSCRSRSLSSLYTLTVDNQPKSFASIIYLQKNRKTIFRKSKNEHQQEHILYLKQTIGRTQKFCIQLLESYACFNPILGGVAGWVNLTTFKVFAVISRLLQAFAQYFLTLCRIYFSKLFENYVINLS